MGSTRDSKAIHRGFDEALGFDLISRYLPYFDSRSKECHFTDPFDRYIWANVRYEVRKDNGPLFKPSGYLTDYLAEEAAKAIRANKAHPFFMYVAFTSMHSPLQALASDYKTVEKIEQAYRADPSNPPVSWMSHCEKVYAAMLLSLDRAVGTLLKALEDNGLDDNTMVIFTNDNGAPQILQGLNAPLRGGKGTFFEGGIKVPFLLRWPAISKRFGGNFFEPSTADSSKPPTGIKTPGVVVDSLISHVDIFPTVMDAAGLSVQADVIDGRTLLPLLSSLSHTPGDGEDTSKTSTRGIMTLGHESLFWRSGHYKAFRYGNWKIMSSGRPNKKWMYNLDDDPGELHNLAENEMYGDKLRELMNLMEKVNETQVMPLWPALLV